MRLDQTARALFLSEFVSAFFLSMRYFFKPKPTLGDEERFVGVECAVHPDMRLDVEVTP